MYNVTDKIVVQLTLVISTSDISTYL